MISPLTKVAKAGDTAQVAVNTTQVQANLAQATANAAGIVGLLALSAATSSDVTTLDTRATATESATTSNTANITGMQAQVNALPTISATILEIDLRNLTQDSAHAGTYATITQNATKADQVTTYTKAEVTALLAALPAGGWTNAEIQVLLDAKGSAVTLATTSQDVADVVSGATTLAAVNVSGTAVVASTLQAAGITSTGSFLGATWAAFGSIPLSPVLGYMYSQAVSATGHISAGSFGTLGSISCASLTQSAPSAGTVLRVTYKTATELGMSVNVSTTTFNPGVTLFTYSHIPSSSSSYLCISLTGLNNNIGGTGNDGMYYTMMYAGGVQIGEQMLGYLVVRHQGSNLTTIQGRYTNSSTNAVSISVVARRGGGDDALALQTTMSTNLTITEVAR
jgi:hypothetical protein